MRRDRPGQGGWNMVINPPNANETHAGTAGGRSGPAPDTAILVALGANLPGAGGAAPIETCGRALDLMPGFGIAIVRRSRWFASAPVPAADQPDFVNGVVLVATALDPEALLGALHRIEDTLGRERPHPNAARVIDLDLIAHGRIRRGTGGGAASGLVLPHPRVHERAFVLLPMADLVPGWRHPASGASLASMIAMLPPDRRCAPIA